MPFPGEGLHPSAHLFPGSTTPPETLLLSAPSDGNSKKAVFVFTANPINEDTGFEVSINGSPWVAASSPYELTDLAAGTYVLEVRAFDASGVDPTPIRHSWRVLAERILSDHARELLSELPGWAQSAPEHKVVCLVYANESDRQEAVAKEVRDGMIPERANALTLPLWETMLKLSVNPVGQNVAARRNQVLARLEQAAADPSGASWETRITRFLGPTWSYEEEEPQTIRVKVPWKPGSPQFLSARRILRAEIPAAWELIVGSEEDFVLDLSQLDLEPLGA